MCITLNVYTYAYSLFDCRLRVAETAYCVQDGPVYNMLNVADTDIWYSADRFHELLDSLCVFC